MQSFIFIGSDFADLNLFLN